MRLFRCVRKFGGRPQPRDASWRNGFASRPVSHGLRHPARAQQVTAVSARASVMSSMTPPKAGRTIGDVRHPFGIGKRSGKISRQLIGDSHGPGPSPPPFPALRSGNSPQACLPHQPGNAMLATPFAMLAQSLPNLWASIDPITLRVKGLNRCGEPLTVLRPGARRPALPSIIATR